MCAPAEEGIEAVHLFSGRTVCRLHLPSPGLNADLNGDGVPDHVVARGGDPAELATRSYTGHAGSAAYCTAVATSGVPPTQPLWNGTICRPYRAALTRVNAMGPVQVQGRSGAGRGWDVEASALAASLQFARPCC